MPRLSALYVPGSCHGRYHTGRQPAAAEQGAGGNAAGYLLLLLAVPFAGFGVGSIAALIATPDRAQPPGGGRPHGDDPPAVPPPPDGGADRSPDNSTEPVVSLA
jgi:hypothetical protein